MIDTPQEAAIGDKAAKDLLEVEKLRAVNAGLLEALQEFDALIKYHYSGSRDAMSDLTYAAKAAKIAIDKALGETK